MPPELALVVQLLHEQVLAAVDDRLHHHVDLAALALRLDDLPALVDGRRHRHGARDVLAGLERRDRLRRVVGDRRVDVHRVDVRVAQQLLVARCSASRCRTGRRTASSSAWSRRQMAYISAFGMVLVDRNELGAEPEPDDGDANLLVSGHA